MEEDWESFCCNGCCSFVAMEERWVFLCGGGGREETSCDGGGEFNSCDGGGVDVCYDGGEEILGRCRRVDYRLS